MKSVKALAVGITGGIGSGKTTVAGIFVSFGATVLSADKIAKDLLNTDERIKRTVRREFGEQMYTSGAVLDSKQLARLVFNDPAALEKLNAIVHPSVIRAIEQEINSFKLKNEKELLLVEAALLFESSADRLFDYIIVVDVPEEERIRRVIARDACSRSDVLQRMKAQLPSTEIVPGADFIIQNSEDMDALKERCRFIFTLLQTISRTS